MTDPSLWRSMARGAVAGFVATVPMTAVMETLRHALLPPGESHAFVPRQVTVDVLRTVGLGPVAAAAGRRGRWGLTAISHFAFGTAAGAVYGALPHRRNEDSGAAASGVGANEVGASDVTPRGNAAGEVAARAGRGALFGTAVWAVSYGVAFPLFGITRPQGDLPVRKNANLLASHLVWGAATAVVWQALARRAASHPADRPVASRD